MEPKDFWGLSLVANTCGTPQSNRPCLMPLEQCYVWLVLFRIWLQSRHTAHENWCLDKKAWVSYSWQFCVLVSASEVNMRSTRKMNNSTPLNIMIWKCGVVVAVVVVEGWQTGIKQLSKAMAAGPWQWGCMSFCSQICTKWCLDFN